MLRPTRSWTSRAEAVAAKDKCLRHWIFWNLVLRKGLPHTVAVVIVKLAVPDGSRHAPFEPFAGNPADRAADPRCAPRCLSFAMWSAGSMAFCTSLTRSGWRRSGTGNSGTTQSLPPAPTSTATEQGWHTAVGSSPSSKEDWSQPSSPFKAIGVRSSTTLATACSWTDIVVQCSRSANVQRSTSMWCHMYHGPIQIRYIR